MSQQALGVTEWGVDASARLGWPGKEGVAERRRRRGSAGWTFTPSCVARAALCEWASPAHKGRRAPRRRPVRYAGSAWPTRAPLCPLQEIATIKLPDLNCTDVEAAMNTIMGTARNMGITVEA